MKAVLDQSPFPPLQLSHDERRRFKRLANDILRSMLSEYDHFGMPRMFSRRRWKVVKSHEHCTVYLDRSTKSSSSSRQSSNTGNSNEYDLSHASVVADSASENSSSTPDDDDAIDAESEGVDWKMPELVVSGTVPGTLADVLYGMTTHDSADILLRTSYVDDYWLDAAVLHQIQLPTAEDPFRFLGIKWYIKGIPKQYQSLVRPRDFVFLEASGTLTRPDGSRVGYFLRHPVDLPTCGELSHHGITRGRFMSYSIYTPLPELNAVDIFVRGKAEPNGKMAQAMAISLTANSLLSSSNAVICSQSKKLTWLLRNAAAVNDQNNRSPVTTTASTHCSVCSRKFGKLSSIAACSVCSEAVCSRCRVNRMLSFVESAPGPYTRLGFAVEQMAGTFCKTCITRANAASAFDVAQREVLSGRYGPVQEAVVTKHHRAQAETQAQMPQSSEPETGGILGQDDLGSAGRNPEEGPSSEAWIYEDDALAASESADGFRANWAPAIPYNVMQESSNQVEDRRQQQQELVSAGSDPNLARQELWRKMTELRLQAESVYIFTKKTSALHLRGSADQQYDSETDELD